MDLAVKFDIIQKSGSWFSMGDTRIGQGKDVAKQYLRDNPNIAASVEAQVQKDLKKYSGAKPSNGDVPENCKTGDFTS